ncbi:MAG: hypothetical protein ACRDBG_25075 [Waterburya sp.]
MSEKARITKVQIGSEFINGIMLPNGDFGITVQQTAELFTLVKSNASKDIKRLLGKGTNLSQTKISESSNGQDERFLTLTQFEKLLLKLVIAGNPQAIQFAEMLLGLSLTQLWSDAFGVKFEREERTQYLINRQEHQKSFHKRLTPFWKEDGCESSKDYSDRVIAFKEAVCLPKYKSVDDYTSEELRLLNAMEIEYKAYRKCGLSHNDALDKLTI